MLTLMLFLCLSEAMNQFYFTLFTDISIFIIINIFQYSSHVFTFKVLFHIIHDSYCNNLFKVLIYLDLIIFFAMKCVNVCLSKI